MSDKKKPIYKKWWFWVFAVFLFFFFLVLITPTPEVEENNTTEEVVEEVSEELTVFDIPTLLGKDIDEIRKILGDPSDGEYTEPNEAQLELGIIEWQNQFDKDTVMLLVDFNVETRLVTGFFIAPEDPTNDTDAIIALTGLSPTDPSYEFEPVKLIKDPKLFTGVVIRVK